MLFNFSVKADILDWKNIPLCLVLMIFVWPFVLTELAKANEYCRSSYTVCEKLQNTVFLLQIPANNIGQ